MPQYIREETRSPKCLDTDTKECIISFVVAEMLQPVK